MAVAGGLLALIGLVAAAVAVYALVRGELGWANIANRRAAGGVLGVALVAVVVAGALARDEPAPADVTFRAHVDGITDGTAAATTTTMTTTAPVEAGASATTAVAAGAGATATTAVAARATPAPASTAPPATARPSTTVTAQAPATTTTSEEPDATTAPTPPASTVSPPTPAASGVVAFGTLQCDAPGTPDDATNANDEWVELVNHGGAGADLAAWVVHDEGANYSFVLPSFTLAAGGRVRIHTGLGQNTATDLYWSRAQHVWNNSGTEIAYLVDPSGAVVATSPCR